MIRSNEKELMDIGAYTPSEYKECLEKLFLVGKYSGIHRDTRRILKKVMPKSILDIGCGDGRLLRSLGIHFPEAACLGIDISQEAIDHAKAEKNIRFCCQKTFIQADVIMATLVLHHLDDDEITPFLQSAYMQANKVVIINDLQRSRLSRELFRMIAKPLFSNRLISHDGIISIEKGFTKRELQAFIAPIEPKRYTIRWRCPFRWQVLLWK